MTSISKFDVNVYSDEVYNIDPVEYAEVQRLMDEDDSQWQGYGEWASQLEATERAAMLEQYAFEKSQERKATVITDSGPMPIKRECAHRVCGYRCAFDVRIGGIAI